VNAYIEKLLMNPLIMVYLCQLMRNVKRAEKNPEYWKVIQRKQIKKFVKYIYTIPFYRERFDRVHLTPKDIVNTEDFLKLPVLTKDEYREWVSAELKENPDKYKHWIHKSTSGSTGIPTPVYMTSSDGARETASYIRGILSYGYSLLKDKIVAVETCASPVESILQKLGLARRIQLIATRPSDYLVEEYNKVKPDFIYGVKTAIQLMAEYSIKLGVKLHTPKCVCIGSEQLDENARTIIEKAFGTEHVVDLYGTVESGFLAASKIGSPSEYVIWHDIICVNILDGNDNPCTSGIGKFTVTTITRKGFPLVNYDQNDLVEVYSQNDILYLKKIYGRRNDRILNEDGSAYSWIHFSKLFKGIYSLAHFRIIQNDYNQLQMLAVKSPFTDKTEMEIEQILTEKANDIFSEHPKKIEFIWKESLPQDANGKLRTVINNIKAKN